MAIDYHKLVADKRLFWNQGHGDLFYNIASQIGGFVRSCSAGTFQRVGMYEVASGGFKSQNGLLAAPRPIPDNPDLIDFHIGKDDHVKGSIFSFPKDIAYIIAGEPIYLKQTNKGKGVKYINDFHGGNYNYNVSLWFFCARTDNAAASSPSVLTFAEWAEQEGIANVTMLDRARGAHGGWMKGGILIPKVEEWTAKRAIAIQQINDHLEALREVYGQAPQEIKATDPVGDFW